MSPTLAGLSDAAERLFWRLLTFADDFGRFPASADVVRGACFPKLEKTYSTARVGKLIAELFAAGLIKLYHNHDSEYGWFVTWDKYQQRRAKTSKFPDPLADASICKHMQAYVPVFEESRNRGIEESRHEESGESIRPNDDTAWLTILGTDPTYQGLSVSIEYGKCQRWCEANHKTLTRRRFINWLNRAERPMNGHVAPPEPRGLATLRALRAKEGKPT